MATDIAFALGVVAVLGSRVPSSVKVLLLTLAIVDDIGAIVVIAVFYTDESSSGSARGAGRGCPRRRDASCSRVVYSPLLAIAGFALWLAVYESGVHATIAGVVMGLFTPARPCRPTSKPKSSSTSSRTTDLRADDVRRDGDADPRFGIAMRSPDRCRCTRGRVT